jgi:acetylornithine deacetylase/succinyl-diaminopimelate desuccinylase-like protein
VTGDEKEIAGFIHSAMKEMGFDVQLQQVVGDRSNVTAKLPGNGSGIKLMLQGHMDTVPVAEGWTSDPYSGSLKNDRVYGQGSTDMKGGLAALIIAVHAILESGIRLSGDLILSCVMGHMEHGLGTEALVDSGLDVDMAIIGEPTDFDVCIAHRGWIYFDIHTRGKVAHTSIKSPNAVVQMAKIALALDQMRFKEPKNERWIRKFFPGPSVYLNVGPIRGGLFPNQVPDSCDLTVDVRPTYNKKPGEVMSEIKATIHRLKAKDPELQAGIKYREGYPKEPLLLRQSEPVIGLVSNSVEETFGKSRVRLSGKNWWTDGSILFNKGRIPTVICGPGGPPYYLTEERLPVKDYLKSIELYIRSALNCASLTRTRFQQVYG